MQEIHVEVAPKSSAPSSGAVAVYDGPSLLESILGPLLEALEPEAGS